MNRARQNENESESEREGNEDRLSDLPDCILLHILSFVKCKDVVRTCVLSRRWKHIWKSLSTLVLHASDFGSVKIFRRFVSKFLCLRDDSVALHTLNFERPGIVELRLLRRVINYAISHNVQQLGIQVGADFYQLPPTILYTIFSCQTLTSLKLSVFNRNYSGGATIVFPESLNLPALTNLYLVNIAFCASGNDQAEPFSTLKRLNTLVIDDCTVKDAQILCICNTTLASLTFPYGDYSLYKLVLSTPNLSSFPFSGVPCHDLSGSGLSSLEQVNIDDADTLRGSSMPALVLLNWLQGLANVQSLTVTVNTLQVLFLIPELLKIQLHLLGNLKSLKVKMQPLSLAVTKALGPATSPRKEKMIQFSPTIIPDGILDFLLQNSLSAEVTIIKW